MRILLLFVFILNFNLIGQESENSYKYEPEGNKAEYFFGKFNRGKDLSDLMDWYDDFADWSGDQGDIWDSMTVGIARPQYSNDLSSHDFMWINTWPDPTSQFRALENWVTDEDAVELFSDIPITNTAVVDTWQWVVSEPRALEASSVMYAVYSECSLEEDVNLRMVYDDYVDFAKFAQENGDTVGRKLIVPTTQTNSDADFHRLMYTSSVSEMGVNADLFWDKLSDSEAAQNLQGWECKNAVSYIVYGMRVAE